MSDNKTNTDNFPCGDCQEYDPILGPNYKKTVHGWCIPRSVYPPYEGPGQIFPPNARKAEEGEKVSPYIVRCKQVFSGCPFRQRATEDPYKRKLAIAQTKELGTK